MTKTRAIVRSVKSVSTGGASDWLFLDAWPSDVDVLWYRITALDRTTDVTRIELLFRRGSEDYVIASQNITAAALDASVAANMHAPGDFRVGARFVGATLGDELEVYAFGELVDLAELNHSA